MGIGCNRQTMPPFHRGYAPVDALPHGVLHSGTALTRSLMYRCRVRGSATSTGIPSSVSRSDFRATRSRRLRSGLRSIKRSRSLSALHGAEDTDVVCTAACDDLADPVPLDHDPL